MGNMFRCTLASGGDGASLIVTCTQNFAGSTITLTNGVKTYTQVCPLSSPYEVTFESVATGVWTVSGIAQGQTFSTSVTITDFEALLADIPEGSTATPTDDIQIWLHCANIWDKSYTTITQVLSDASTLQALIASANAVDYMVRSTTWANDVTANSSAMTYIGANNYCADTLLNDSTWMTSICESTFFENVLNVKVPTMTSATTPSGLVISSGYQADGPAFHVFDGNITSLVFYTTAATGRYVGYQFTENVCIKKISYQGEGGDSYFLGFTFYIDASADGSSWNELGSYTLTASQHLASKTTPFSATLPNNNKYSYYRLRCNKSNYNYNNRFQVGELQFYGRA